MIYSMRVEEYAMKNFGINRVIEPKGSLPVTAWKLDNSKELNSGEVLISLDYVAIERDSMCQLCSICQHSDEEVVEKIIKMVEERGKIHNPYTNSGGICSGVIEAISEDCQRTDIKVGDRVLFTSTLTGIPVHIEEIEEVDFDFAQIKCKGYAIAFETTALTICDKVPEERMRYLRRVIDKEGTFYGVKKILDGMTDKRVLLIGASLVEIVFFAQLVRDTVKDADISLLIENGCTCTSSLNKVDVIELLSPLVDHVYFDSMSDSMTAAKKVCGQDDDLMDVVINLENINNCESVAALAVKSGGLICHTYVYNNYSDALLITESLGKSDVINYALDSVFENAVGFATDLVDHSEKVLQKLDEYFDGSKKKLQKKFKHGAAYERHAARQIDGFIYMSHVTENLISDAINIAKYDCNVIIEGETGVGKERIFDLIQQNSSRKSHPCIKVNCATIQENLAESEFFGYEKGAFTGASSQGKEGYFELANNGTLFLDEIGSLPLTMQSKLLRVLQENTFYRVGGTKPKHVNVRVICANNVPLKKLVDEGKFREDLYYRLNICEIQIPPLRMRKEDIYCLAEEFIKGYSKKYGVEKSFSPDAYRALSEYHWPGNVRELENTVHRLYISERDKIISGDVVDDLLNTNVYEESIMDIKKEFNRQEALDFKTIMERQEKKLIAYALKKEGSTRKAAELLNLPQPTLARKKIKYDL